MTEVRNAQESRTGIRLLECDTTIASERDAVDLIGRAFAERPDWIVIPIERLGDGLLDLKTRILGEVIQKFVNYGFRVAFVGDVTQRIAASKPFADFVREANRGTQLRFAPDRAALRIALERGGVSPGCAPEET